MCQSEASFCKQDDNRNLGSRLEAGGIMEAGTISFDGDIIVNSGEITLGVASWFGSSRLGPAMADLIRLASKTPVTVFSSWSGQAMAEFMMLAAGAVFTGFIPTSCTCVDFAQVGRRSVLGESDNG